MRSLGLTGVVQAGMRLVGLENPVEYEKPVRDAVCREVRAGDIAWDIGANRGVYTALLSELVGTSGQVLAIEPEAKNVETLRQASWAHSNVVVLDAAMSHFNGECSLQVATNDETGRTHRLTSSECAEGSSQRVHVVSGDGIIAAGLSVVPNFVKVDVEGAEADVLKGCSGLLANTRLRALLLEVHFGLLAARGDAFAPARIELLLHGHGFTTRWLDRSHVLATRR